MWPAMLCNRRFGGEDVGVEFRGWEEECGESLLEVCCGDMIFLYSYYRSYQGRYGVQYSTLRG